jgi:hypothetical protein
MAAERTVAGLLSDLSGQMSTLFRQEALLARTEIVDRLHAYKRDAAAFAVAGVLALAALLKIVDAVVLALVEWEIAPWLSSAIVGVALALIAGALITARIRSMSSRPAAPVEAIESLKESAQWLKHEALGRTGSK